MSRASCSGKQAVGVEIERSGERQRIEAEREIVLSGGAINSPQLLQLGWKQALARHGITQVVDLQGVGQNLQDHLDVTVMIRDRSKQAIEAALFSESGRRALVILAQARGFVQQRG